MYVSKHVSLFKENIKSMIGDMQIAKKSWLWDLTTKVWDVLDVIIFTVLGS